MRDAVLSCRSDNTQDLKLSHNLKLDLFWFETASTNERTLDSLRSHRQFWLRANAEGPCRVCTHTCAHTTYVCTRASMRTHTHNGGKRINLDTSLPLFPTTSISVHPQCPTAALTALRGRTWVYKPVVGHTGSHILFPVNSQVCTQFNYVGN